MLSVRPEKALRKVRPTHSSVQAHVLNVIVRIFGYACFMYHRQLRKRRVSKEVGADRLPVQRPCRGLAIAISRGLEVDIDEIPASSRTAAATTGTCCASCERKKHRITFADRFIANSLSGFPDYACPFVAEDCWVFAGVSKEPVSE
jgi:hypothetical protein